MCMGILRVHAWHHGAQEIMLDPLEMELLMAVSHFMGTGIKFRSSVRTASALTLNLTLQLEFSLHSW